MAPTGLSAIRERIAVAADAAGRDPAAITLVAVTKYATDEQVQAIYDAGVRQLAENRTSGLEARSELLPDDVSWHFVGRLQSNKARRVRPIARLLHSLDRPSLAEAWLKGPGSPPPALLQVDTAGEEQKGGVPLEGAMALADRVVELGIDLRGLMAIPPADTDPRPHFAALRMLRDRIAADHPAVTELSMGMSSDFEAAIGEGATILRVGRAIFGEGGSTTP
jgi:hypothetical protein